MQFRFYIIQNITHYCQRIIVHLYSLVSYVINFSEGYCEIEHSHKSELNVHSMPWPCVLLAKPCYLNSFQYSKSVNADVDPTKIISVMTKTQQ